MSASRAKVVRLGDASGSEITGDGADGVVGLSLLEACSALAPEAEYATRVELAERYKSAFRELHHDPSEVEILFPQAGEIIAHLGDRENYLLGIATGKSRRGIDRLFAREGWHARFATIQTADDHPSKPHPSMLLRAMLETSATPEATVMIGDTTYDIAMAHAAGARAIGVAWGYHPVGELQAIGADEVVGDPALIASALERIFARIVASAAE